MEGTGRTVVSRLGVGFGFKFRDDSLGWHFARFDRSLYCFDGVIENCRIGCQSLYRPLVDVAPK